MGVAFQSEQIISFCDINVDFFINSANFFMVDDNSI